MTFQLKYKAFGDVAILIEWPAKIDEAIIQDIVAFEKKIAKTPDILDTIIAYNSLTIRYRVLEDFDRTVSDLKRLYLTAQTKVLKDQKVWQIPVCYDVKFGLDLEEMSVEKNIPIDAIIKLHSTPQYLIYFLGFQPGFLYLGGLDVQIHMPRRATPRLRVEKGAVGIGGEQTGAVSYTHLTLPTILLV